MKISNSSLSIRSKMTLILDTGQLMMESGAGSKRIVRDMLRTAACLGIYWEDVQIHITYSTIMVKNRNFLKHSSAAANEIASAASLSVITLYGSTLRPISSARRNTEKS